MRTWQALWLIPAALAAQQPQSATVAQGLLLEHDNEAAGEFSLRAADNHVLRYRFDEKTLIDRDQLRSSMARLEPGDKVEVISDDGPASSLRYARTVHAQDVPRPQQRPVSQNRYRAYRPLEDPLLSNGTLTYAGVVFRLNRERMVLHTRDGGDQTILLRQDTRYLGNGEVAEPDELRTNMRVFVRAGHTLFNEVEAYQVVWGEILMPPAAGR